MIFSKKFANFSYLCLFLLYLLGEYLIDLSNESKNNNILVTKNKEPIKKFVNTTLNGNTLYLIKEHKYFKESKITEIFDLKYKDYIHFIRLKGTSDVKNIVALGIDKKYHIANFYLEGYAPFKTDKLWIPLQTLARKKVYQLDDLQYKGYNEIWQTSSQAFKYTRGDCEDHAIALADWLIEMGEDARVVIGKYKKVGHAWVVLFKNNKEYILEATQKRNLRKPYLLAKYQPNYKAKMMFNREYFWYIKNEKSSMNYSSSNWIKKSTYIKQQSKY